MARGAWTGSSSALLLRFQKFRDSLHYAALSAVPVLPPGGQISIALPDECSQRHRISSVLRQERCKNTIAVEVPPCHLHCGHEATVARQGREGAEDGKGVHGHALWFPSYEHSIHT